jgi:hypothetical protein
MKLKFSLSLLLMAILSSALFAKEISRSQAEKVAVNAFYEKTNNFGQQINYLDINIIDSYKVEDAFYVVNFDNGWVVVSADDATTPVLGYNLNGKYPSEETANYNFKSWMQHYIDQYEFVKSHDIQASSDISLEWDRYNTNNPDILTNADRDVSTPLLTATWNQDNPYNLLCPADDAGPGGHVYVGCVATAMAQIMHYWRYPDNGSGSFAYYQYPYGVISANFDTTYYWNGMQDQINNSNPWDIALIGFHAAVSVQMDFGPDGSGSYSWDVPSALEDHFNYSPAANYIEKNNYSTSVWENYMQQDLDQEHPIYYSGFSSSGGHAFVCDGYQGMNYYHFNFGWSGSGNGFYTLQDVNGFNSGQGMVRNIFPGDANYPYIASGADTLTFKSGSFTDGSGPCEDYTPGMNASWLISPQTEMDSIESISLSFVEFNTAVNDVLRVYNGNDASGELLGEFSGSTMPTTISCDNNEMFITFSSSGSKSGFKAEYNSSSPTWCSGAQTFTEPSGTIVDGSGDFYYNNDATCVFSIQNPEAVKITLEFTSFATEADKDKVTVFNGNNQVIATLSGQDLPDPIVEETNAMFITWSTNNSIRDLGWSADYFVDGVGVQENEGDYKNLMIFPNPSTGIFNLNFNLENSSDIDILVSDLNGRIIYSAKIKSISENYKTNIDLSDIAKGVYTLSIISDNGKTDRKIIIE